MLSQIPLNLIHIHLIYGRIIPDSLSDGDLPCREISVQLLLPTISTTLRAGADEVRRSAEIVHVADEIVAEEDINLIGSPSVVEPRNISLGSVNERENRTCRKGH